MQLDLSRSLHALVGHLDRVADRILKAEHGLSYAQFLALYAVAENADASQRAVASWLGATEAATSRTLRALAEDGLVRIAPGGGHRRAVGLTDAGRRIVETAGAELEQRLAEALGEADVEYDSYTASTARLLATVSGASR